MKILAKNKYMILYLVLFMIISFISIYSASMYLSPTLGKLYYKQLFWYTTGILLILLFRKVSMTALYRNSWILYIGNVILLLGLLLFMPDINGSKSWYVLKGIGSIQPSEFMKISLILLNANVIYHFYKKEKRISTKREFQLILSILIIVAIPSILTFLQPDTGSVIIYFIISFSMLFVSGIDKKWFFSLLLIVAFLLTVFLSIYFFQQELFIEVFGSNFFYRMDRLLNWQSGSGMQLNNSLVAIGSSGILGHGFNQTPLYFPEAGTDFIFTVYASNFGLIGSILMITFLLSFNLYLINISKSIYSIKDKYTIIGILSVMFYQQIQNIGMTLGLLPITGITLPFISYGGSSLLSYLLLIGIVLKIVKTDQQKKAYK